MATLSVVNPTLADVAKATDPDGKIATIVEILNETNEILDDMVWKEGNLPTGHRTTIRAGLPAPTWRKLYGGVQPNKATNVQVTDTTGMLEAYAEIEGRAVGGREHPRFQHREAVGRLESSVHVLGRESGEMSGTRRGKSAVCMLVHV